MLSLRPWLAVSLLLATPAPALRAQAAPDEGTIEIRGSSSVGEDDERQWVAVVSDQPTASGVDGYTPSFPGVPTDWLRPFDLRWDFGDGAGPISTGERTAITHAFPDDGTYTLRVEAWTSDGRVASGESEIEVRNRNPVDLQVGAIEIDPTRGRFELTAMATDAVGDPLTYEWDFGDGERDTGTAEEMQRVEHDYPLAGTYPVTLTVRDDDGGERSETRRVVVVGAQGSSGDTVDPLEPDTLSEAVSTSFQGRLSGSMSSEIDPEIRPVAGLHLAAIEDGKVCRFLFSAWDDATLSYVLAIFDLRGVPEEGGARYVLGRPRVDVNFEADAERYEGMKQLVMPGGTRAGLGSVIAPLVGGLDDRQRADVSRQVGVTPGERERREPVPMPAVSPFGIDDHEGFQTVAGTVELDLVPRERAFARLNLQLRNVDEDSGRPEISLAGDISFDLRAMQRDGLMLWDRCGPGEFSIEQVSPVADEKHRFSLQPWVYVDFSSAVDPATLDTSTYQLTYVSAATGEPVPVEAELVRRDRQVILQPKKDLFTGVRYTARVKTGSDGVRGRNGVALEDEDGSGWYQWSFTTRVGFVPGGSDENLACHVFQSVRDAPLIPDKPAVARIHASWKPHPEVAAATQVEDFEARVVLLRGQDEVASTLHRFVRPDLWDARGIRQAEAEHTANLFFTPQEGLPSTLRVGVRVNKKPGESYENGYWSRCSTPIWPYRPKLSVDVHMLALNAWEDDEVREPLSPLIGRVMRDAQVFLKQAFPLAEVETEFRSILRRPRIARLTEPDFVAKDPYPGNLLSTFTRDSTADVIVGYVPLDENMRGGEALQRITPGEPAYVILGLATDADADAGAVVTDSLRDLYERNVFALVHEIGHALWLDHLPVVDSPQRDALTATRNAAFGNGNQPVHWHQGIEGFRIDPNGNSGINKSSTEGNGEGAWLTPVMFPASIPYRWSFIVRQQYLKMQCELEARGGQVRGTGSGDC